VLSSDDDLAEAIRDDAKRAVVEYRRRAKDGRLASYYARIGKALARSTAERRQRLRLLLATIGTPPTMKVLDVGCGRGEDLADLAKAGWNTRLLAGVEIFPDALAEARRVLPNALLLEGNAAQLPFASESFDATMQCTVLSSILDPRVRLAVADEMWRVTRRGGLVVSYDMRSGGRNPQLVGIDRGELARLFASRGVFAIESITLPLAITSRVPPVMARALNRVSFLRDHYLFWQKRD
jgi:ubiquinone/menaquinone biosynthesis C-methylase UbiE